MTAIHWTLPLALLAFAAAATAAERPEIQGATHPTDHVVVGGQPDEAALQQVAAAGIRHVLNMRSTAEVEELDFDQERLVRELGMTYHHLPVENGPAGLTPESLVAFDRIMREIGDEPALMHCASGNRVGGYVALRAGLIEGLVAEEAVARGKAWGMTRLEDDVRAVLENGFPAEAE